MFNSNQQGDVVVVSLMLTFCWRSCSGCNQKRWKLLWSFWLFERGQQIDGKLFANTSHHASIWVTAKCKTTATIEYWEERDAFPFTVDSSEKMGGLTDKLGKVSDQESDKVTGGRLGGWQTNNFKKREEHNEHNTLLLREGLVHWSIQETGWEIEKCAHSVWTGGEYGDGQCGRRSVSKGKTVHNASIEAGTRGRMVTDRP